MVMTGGNISNHLILASAGSVYYTRMGSMPFFLSVNGLKFAAKMIG